MTHPPHPHTLPARLGPQGQDGQVSATLTSSIHRQRPAAPSSSQGRIGSATTAPVRPTTPQERQQRDAAIVAALRSGVTQSALAWEYSLTRERIRQIARRHGLSGLDMCDCGRMKFSRYPHCHKCREWQRPSPRPCQDCGEAIPPASGHPARRCVRCALAYHQERERKRAREWRRAHPDLVRERMAQQRDLGYFRDYERACTAGTCQHSKLTKPCTVCGTAITRCYRRFRSNHRPACSRRCRGIISRRTCPECGANLPDDKRVGYGMKCPWCAYGPVFDPEVET